jgi:hypothetical protein
MIKRFNTDGGDSPRFEDHGVAFTMADFADSRRNDFGRGSATVPVSCFASVVLGGQDGAGELAPEASRQPAGCCGSRGQEAEPEPLATGINDMTDCSTEPPITFVPIAVAGGWRNAILLSCQSASR